MLGINFRKYISAGLIFFVVSSILCVADAYAESAPVFKNLTDTGWEIFAGMRKIIFGAAGFGIIAVAIGGFFGTLNWKWLSAIVIGLVVISLTVAIVRYLVMGHGQDVSTGGIADTLIYAE